MRKQACPCSTEPYPIEIAAAARIKRELSAQFRSVMSHEQVSQAELARRMHTSRAVVHRLLNDDDLSVTLATISRAAVALSQVVHVEISR